MTKKIKAKKKISRKLGLNLWGDDNSSFLKRNYPPGQHGANSRSRKTVYGTQLFAKQTLKFYYGISEKQFRNTFKKASNKKGNTGEIFVSMLESRLDVLVYRLNFVSSIFAARQLVVHKHIKVNNQIVNCPSYLAKKDDIISVKEKSTNIPALIDSLEKMSRSVPSYVALDSDNRKAMLNATPNLEEVPYPFEPNLQAIIEFYSK